MKIILLRHAPALTRDAQRWPDDTERPLSEPGEKRAARVSHGLVRIVGEVHAIWSSPAARAWQTAQILRNAHPRRPPLTPVTELLPDGRLQDLIGKLAAARAQDTVILVGHEPTLGRLAGVLLGGPRSRRSLPLKKAGAACFDLASGTLPGDAQLDWWLPPRLLRRIS